MLMLLGSVGNFEENYLEDVILVQGLLNQHQHVTGTWLVEDGEYGHKTAAALHDFQRKVLVMRLPDGKVTSNGITFARLQTSSIKTVLAGPPVPAASTPPNSVLTEDDYKKAADTLGCEVAAIKAVASVETPKAPFDSQGRPTILYERHYFSRLTNKAYNKTHPEISAPTPYGPGQYGSYDAQYTKLGIAYKLDQDAALKSASWGAFQIMGNNYKQAGYANIQDFVAAMKNSVSDHLDAFVNIINANQSWKTAIQKKDWAAFARNYNGPKYAVKHYDTRMADAYKKNIPHSK